MIQLISDLNKNWHKRPFIWSGDKYAGKSKTAVPEQCRILVLAPHPDDPECVAVTARHLKESGYDIYYSIVSMSPNGVEDDYARQQVINSFLSLSDKKIEIRRQEQIRSAKMFGLISDRIAFLNIQPDTKESLFSAKNRSILKHHLEAVAPDAVLMPNGKDTNKTHQWVYTVFRAWAAETERNLTALYFEDPKTTDIRPDLYVLFNEKIASWKRDLLKIHDSQQQRNIRLNGSGFDDRILELNRKGFKRLLNLQDKEGPSACYAEVFEVEIFK